MASGGQWSGSAQIDDLSPRMFFPLPRVCEAEFSTGQKGNCQVENPNTTHFSGSIYNLWEVEMRASQIKPDDKVAVMEIATKMRGAGLPNVFIASAAEMAFQFEGVLDLFLMWNDEPQQSERDEIIADIQELVEDYNQKELVEAVYVRFDDLETIGKDIRAFKDNLRALVDKHGGLTQLAQKIEVPQPSLSRFFNSGSMPRRNTLNKIAKALGLSKIQIATEYSK